MCWFSHDFKRIIQRRMDTIFGCVANGCGTTLVIRFPYGDLHIKLRKPAGLQLYPVLVSIIMNYKAVCG